MTNKTQLKDVLTRFMNEAKIKAPRLSNLVNDHVGYELLTRSTLVNWLKERAEKARAWQPFVAIATVLERNENDTDELLLSAGQPSLSELRSIVTEENDQIILQLWEKATYERQTAVLAELKVPLEKPPSPDHFVGRDDEIERILADLQPGKIVALCGPGGVGKTALASEVIRRLTFDNKPPDRFPDGIIYIPFYEKPEATQALEYISSRYGFYHRDENLTLEAAARRSLEGKQALLVLDGTENTDNLRQVLSVRGECGVLITSRFKKDARTIRHDIEELPLSEAQELLKTWAGGYADEEEAVARICELVGRLPLAIVLAGGHLSGTGLTATEFVPELKMAGLEALNFKQRQHKSVLFLLKKSTEQLDESTRQTLGITGLLGYAPFTHEVITVAKNISAIEERQQLGVLVARCLATRPVKKKRYQLAHRLVHQYAQKYLAKLVDTEIVERILNYYVALAKEKPEPDIKDFAKLDDEFSHITAIIETSISRKLWEPVLTLSMATNEYLHRRGQWGNRAKVNAARLIAAQKLEDTVEEAQARESLGIDQTLLSQWSAAEQSFQEAFRTAQKVQCNELIGSIELNWGNLLLKQNRHKEAIAKYQSSLEVYRSLKDQVGQAMATNGLGNAHSNLGEIGQAKSLFEQSLQLFQTANTPSQSINQAKVLDNLGVRYRELREFDQAIELHQQAITIFQRLGGIQAELLSTMRLGSAYMENRNLDQGIEMYQRSKKLSEAIGDFYTLNIILGNLGIAYRRQENFGLAINTLNKSVELSQKLNDKRRQGSAHNTLGLIFKETGEPEKSIESHKRAIRLFRSAESGLDEARATLNLGDIYLETENFDEAQKQLQRALAKFQQYGSQGDQVPALGALGSLCEKQGRKEEARDYWQQAREKSKLESPVYKILSQLLEKLECEQIKDGS